LSTPSLSAAYGVAYPQGPIHDFRTLFDARYCLHDGLPSVLGELLERSDNKRAYRLLAARTWYRRVAEGVDSPKAGRTSGLQSAVLLSPRWLGGSCARETAPRALGQATSALVRGDFRPEAEAGRMLGGLELQMNRLYQ